MKKTIPFFLTLFFTLYGSAQSQYAPEILEKIKQVENYLTRNVLINDKPSSIKERMKEYKVKGMSIAVIKDYKVEWAKGYGWADEEEKRPVTNQTLFQAGSISKSLNALGILKLVQEGKLDLYTDINAYLTSWKFPYDSLSKGKKITLAHLLSHTAGLSTHGFRGHNIKTPVPSILQVLDAKAPTITSTRIQGGSIITVPPVRSMFEPGLQFQYSGGGTTISQLVLTDVTNKPYDSWMYQNVLVPLGMTASSYDLYPKKEKVSCASGYYADGSRVLNKFHVLPEAAGGGLWSTPLEISKYIIDMQLAYKGQKSKVLSSEMIKLHLTPYNNGPTGLGTFIDNIDSAVYFQHGAGTDGFCGQYYASLEDGYGVVVFLNSEDGRLLSEVINSVARVYKWKNFYHEPQKKYSIPVADTTLKKYEGIYLFENSWAGIGKKDNVYQFYTFGWGNYMYQPMHFSTPTTFFNEEFPAIKKIILDEKGNVTGYSRIVGDKEYPRSVKVTKPDTLNLESNIFTDIGWYLLENKKKTEALTYLKRGALLHPKDLNLQMSTAHLYLLNGDYKNAVAIYKAHLTEDVYPGLSWVDLLKNDLIYFKEYHYDVKLFDKVFKELKIKKPAGY
ncbi:MAG TPA: serine hydrolase domain-containing protein [Bacteroidia bacterium]